MTEAQPAYVLHALPYKETSLVVELWTRDYGRIPAVAKGAKRPHSALRSALLSFQPLLIKLSGRGEIKNLTHAEWAGGHLPPEGQALFSSYYINELLMRCLQRADAHPELFNHYAHTLAKLANHASVSIAIRAFELQLLQSIGFGVSFSKDSAQQLIQSDRRYQWVSAHGWRNIGPEPVPPNVSELQKTNEQQLVFAGHLLLDVAQTGIVSELHANALRPLTRMMLNECLGYQNLLSRSWMEQLKKS